VNASERIAIGDPVSRRFTLTATGHLNDSEVIQELTTCVVLYMPFRLPLYTWSLRANDTHTHTHARLTALCQGLPG